MQKHFDSVFVLDNDSNVVPLAGATIAVYDLGTSTPSTIYSDNGVTPLSNPFTSDGDGAFEFYAANGRYDIKVTKSPYRPNFEYDVLLFDPDDAPAGTGGSGGTGGGGYLHHQSVGSATWTVVHNLGRLYPSVDVYGNDNQIISPDYIESIDSNTIEIGFGGEVLTGYAYISSGEETLFRSHMYDTAGDPVFYIGEALSATALTSDPVWRIRKSTVSGSSVTVLWADGDQSADNIWDNRAALTYS